MAPTKGRRVVVEKRVLVRRIQLALSKKGQKLVTTKKASKDNPGVLVIINAKSGAVVREDVDLGELARDLDVLNAWETV